MLFFGGVGGQDMLGVSLLILGENWATLGVSRVFQGVEKG